MAIGAKQAFMQYGMPAIFGLSAFRSRRKAHPDENILVSGAHTAFSSIFWKPISNFQLGMGLPAAFDAARTQYLMGGTEYGRHFRSGALGGGYRDTETASMLRNQTLERGMSAREALAGRLGSEARRYYAGR